MKKEIIINSSALQTRIAITEDDKLVDFFVEEPDKRRMVGDIYLGKVAKILPGIKAAFIDIGQKHDAFLHFSDIGYRLEALQSIFEDNDDDASGREDDDDEDVDFDNEELKFKRQNEYDAAKKLKKGKEILVQIAKEPVGEKGVRVTASIVLPGRFCVLLPYDNKIGISKKITDIKERKRLRTIAKSIIPKKCGLIIRTAAKDQDEEILREDLNNLLKTWKVIEKAARNEEPPALLYQDLNTTSSVIRDLMSEEVSKIWVDSRKLYRQIKNYLEFVQPEFADRVEFYKEKTPIFEKFKIEEQIKLIFSRKVPLPSGGYLVIEHTEAMTVIDVNSGKYIAKKEQEQNSLKTDLEAAREIARQLRLRDIGGLIVCDFIDLEDEKNKKKIYDEFKKEFKKDRAKVVILPMTEFGLVQITRQRVRHNIIQSTYETCPYCLGSGILAKESSVIHNLEDALKKVKSEFGKRSISLETNPSLAKKLKEKKFVSLLTKLQFKYLMKIKIVENIKLNTSQFRILEENKQILETNIKGEQ